MSDSLTRRDLEASFPRLRNSSYKITSPEDNCYNCIAWAAGDMNRWWWPDAFHTAYWPPEAPREESVTAFMAVFAALGFEECSNDSMEPGFEKIAIFAVDDHVKHTARQLENGAWTSKLGRAEDIEHRLPDLVSERYGTVIKMMRRANAEEKGR
jgi:hypothetical protein